MSEWEARLGLSTVTEPGDPTIARDVERLGAEEVWDRLKGTTNLDPASASAMRAREFQPEQVLDLASKAEARFIIPGDPEWPTGLRDLTATEPIREQAGAPLGLWAVGVGDLADLTRRSVTIDGARASTTYGETVAFDMATDLAHAGYSIISGGSYGIGSIAHRAALAARTPTVVVLPSGVDRAYPAAHRGLFERVAATGVILSELAPGQHPTRYRFLARGRILAALSQATVLVEATARSGALNTVRWANRLSRLATAVPGPISSAQSYLPHRLISQGDALLVASAAEVCQALDSTTASQAAQPSTAGWEQVPNQTPRPAHDRPVGLNRSGRDMGI